MKKVTVKKSENTDMTDMNEISAMLVEGIQKQTKNLEEQLKKSMFDQLRKDTDKIIDDIFEALGHLENMNIGLVKNALNYITDNLDKLIEDRRKILTGEPSKRIDKYHWQ